MPKVDPAEVLYYPPEHIGSKEGAHCSICMMYWQKDGKGHCTAVAGGEDGINGKTGYCGLYVFGKHMGPDMDGKLSKEISGYGEDGPTHCGSCIRFIEGRKEKDMGGCDYLKAPVHFYACCDAWKPLDKSGQQR